MNYFIKKISMGEHKEINKKFTLNLNRYCSNTSILYFDVEEQEIPFLMDFSAFFNIMSDQIKNGLIEKMDYNNGVITVSIRDRNIIKNYTYDFKVNEFCNYPMNSSNLDYLKSALFKIISMYKENPNSSTISEQKYIWFIFDILNGDRIPNIDNPNELLRIYEVYNYHKEAFLEVLLNNTRFYDNNGNILGYSKKLLKLIKQDVYMQMEAAILIFAEQTNSTELYQQCLEKTYIPRREIVYESEEEKTIFSSSKDLLKQRISNLKRLVKIKRRNK